MTLYCKIIVCNSIASFPALILDKSYMSAPAGHMAEDPERFEYIKNNYF